MATIHIRGVAALAIATALIAGACSGATTSIAGALASAAAEQASDAPVPADSPADGEAVPDPCAALTTADVQPFFTVQIATQLPSAVPNTCEWAAGDAPLGVPTSLDVMVVGGDDADLRWRLATTGGSAVLFSGVGDQAEHAPGTTDFLAFKDHVACGITTLGWAHLVGKADHEPGQLGDADATAIAQDYGTLCNRIYGSGNTVPTLVAQAPASVAPDSAAPGTPPASIAIPAVGGTFGPGFPLPVGVDCAGAHLTTDLDGSPECATLTSGDPRAIYPFYLQTLPADGYTIHVQRDGIADDGTEIASIMFGGKGIGDLSTINVRGLNVTITLRQP